MTLTDALALVVYEGDADDERDGISVGEAVVHGEEEAEGDIERESVDEGDDDDERREE